MNFTCRHIVEDDEASLGAKPNPLQARVTRDRLSYPCAIVAWKRTCSFWVHVYVESIVRSPVHRRIVYSDWSTSIFQSEVRGSADKVFYIIKRNLQS